jgi:hypothetical protein
MSDAFASFSAGGGFELNGETGGSWYVTPASNPSALAGDDGRVLLAQLTAADDAEGNAGHVVCDWNLQWRDVSGVSSNVIGLLVDTSDSPVDLPGCMDASACNYQPSATQNDGSCEFISCQGCMEPTACNFDLTSTIADESCEFVTCAGCTAFDACNYDPSATIEDGSCDYDCSDCLADLDGDGAIAVSDILMLLSDFGCDFPPCIGAANGDGATNVSDLLILLSQFGETCAP